MKYDIRQIRIGKHDVGIVGLTDAIEMVAANHKSSADNIIAEALYEALKKHNYISDHVKEAYKQAFFREYQKHLGIPVTAKDGVPDELTVTVVGPGCPRCENLEMEVMMALSELNLPARVDHVRDPKEIGRMGIFGTPSLLFNDEVKCVGVVPSRAQLIEWLKPYKNN
jgi:hypothetical protein